MINLKSISPMVSGASLSCALILCAPGCDTVKAERIVDLPKLTVASPRPRIEILQEATSAKRSVNEKLATKAQIMIPKGYKVVGNNVCGKISYDSGPRRGADVTEAIVTLTDDELPKTSTDATNTFNFPFDAAIVQPGRYKMVLWFDAWDFTSKKITTTQSKGVTFEVTAK